MKEKFTLRFWIFDTASYKHGETYLEKMAEKGLLLRKIGRNDLTCYEKIEKDTRLKFHIHVQAHVQDNEQEFIEFKDQWQENGWDYICSNRNFHYFKTNGDSETKPLPSQQETLQKLLRYDFYQTRLVIIAAFYVLFFLLAILFQKDPNFFIDQSTSVVLWPCFRTILIILLATYTLKSIFDYKFITCNSPGMLSSYLSMKNFISIQRIFGMTPLLLMVLAFFTLSHHMYKPLVQGLFVLILIQYFALFSILMDIFNGTKQKIFGIAWALGLVLLFVGQFMLFYHLLVPSYPHPHYSQPF